MNLLVGVDKMNMLSVNEKQLGIKKDVEVKEEEIVENHNTDILYS